MKTAWEEYLETGKIYAATPDDKCMVCGRKIGKKLDFVTTLKIDPSWDRKEKFDFNKHVTDELKGYQHFKCSEKTG